MPAARFFGFLLLVLFALPTLAGNYRWTIQGPAGGTINQLEFDPTDPSIVYAASDNGLFRSSDAGQHWAAAKELLGTSAIDVAVAPGDPRKVFVSTAYGLFGSVDRGVTWRVVHRFASFEVAASSDGAVVYSVSTNGLLRSQDGGATFGNAGSGLPGAAITTIAIDPLNPDTLYVSLFSIGGVYKSVDGGAHWTAANTGLTASLYFSLIVDPSNGQTLYAGAGGAIYKTTNGGASWSALPTGQGSLYCRSLAISAGTPAALVAGTDRGVMTSTNGGASWSSPKLNAPIAVAIDPLNPSNVLAVALWNLLRSTDGGAHYTLVGEGLNSFYLQAITADPQNASTVYAAGPGGTFRSVDRGQTWSALESTATSPIGPSTTTLAVDSGDSSILYSISSNGMRRSVNGGSTWEPFAAGLPAGFGILLTVDPRMTGTLYTVINGTIYKKTAATVWTIRNGGLPAGFSAYTVRADPQNGATLYAGGSAGLFKSLDGGESWSAINDGLTAGSAVVVAVDPFDSSHLFTWSSTSAYESKNGGTSWTLFPGVGSGSTLVFDASTAGRIYERAVDGVKRSADGGHTWLPLAQSAGTVSDSVLVVAPDGRTLYAGGPKGGVWTYHLDRRRAASH